ncbi:MAG: histidinol-phosphate aminotransferase family protein [Phycisphaerales bacterium]|nr:histidinol-phosphate aminotransferase family protein [Phycisphaerales bacterium]
MTTPTQSAALRPAARLQGITPYRPPPFDPSVDLRLDANEGAAPGEAALAALAQVDAERLRRYPDASGLEAQIADRLGVAPGRVVVTNGGDDAIDRLCRATLEPGRSLVVHRPTFEMIGRGARLAGASVREVRWVEGPPPVGQMLSLIDETTGLVAVVSPNNPTGAVISRGEIEQLASGACAVGAVLLVDLAYVEFADEDPTDSLLALENTVLVRTFSKAYALAGLRVGYAIAPPAIAEWLRATGGPYPVSGVSLAVAAGAHGADPAARHDYIGTIRRERSELSRQLSDKGAKVLPSQANFVSAFVRDASALRERLAARGIAIRTFRGGGDTENLVRITLPGGAGPFERLTNAIGEIQEVWA